jgi:hypothetical protein
MLTHAGVPEQGGAFKRSALMLASKNGMTGVVEKLLAAGAKAELTDEVKGRRGGLEEGWQSIVRSRY